MSTIRLISGALTVGSWTLLSRILGFVRDILIAAALDESFADASGTYFDNDSRRFAPPHPDALDQANRLAVIERIESILAG